MPTEHEYKNVLSLDLLKELSESNLVTLAKKTYLVQQGYLCTSKDMSCRIRSIVECDTNNKVKWYMTFKQKIGDRVVEIEKKVSIRDGKDLWSVAINKVKKTRCIFEHESNRWELDLIQDELGVYCIVAEIELEEGMPRPNKMPLFMSKHLLLEVDLEDDRFANKYLSDRSYVTNLYQDLISGKR